MRAFRFLTVQNMQLTTTKMREVTFLNKTKLLKDHLFVIEKFHPLALFVACGLLILMIEKSSANIPLIEKTIFLILAGPLYVIDISYESWRIARMHPTKTKDKINA